MTFWRGACSVLAGCGIFGGHLQCFGGVLAVFWKCVIFWRRRFQCFGGVWHF